MILPSFTPDLQKLFDKAVLNYETPDPECPVAAATNGSSPVECFINLSITPQGQASAALVRGMD